MTRPDSQVTTGELFNLIGNDLRIDILKLLYSEPYSFSNILNQLSLESTSKLSFHLNKMEKLIQKREDGRYQLSQLGNKVCLQIYNFEEGQISYSPHHLNQASASFPQINPLSFLLGIIILGLAIQVYFLILNPYYIDVIDPLVFFPIFSLPVIYYIGKLSNISFELTRMISIQFFLILTFLLSGRVAEYFFLVYFIGFFLVDTIIKNYPTKDRWNSKIIPDDPEFIGPAWLLRVDSKRLLIIGVLVYEIIYFYTNHFTFTFSSSAIEDLAFIVPSGLNYLLGLIFALILALLIYLIYVKTNISNTNKTIISSLLLMLIPIWLFFVGMERISLPSTIFLLQQGSQYSLSAFETIFLMVLSFIIFELVITGIILFIVLFELKLFSTLRSYFQLSPSNNNSSPTLN